ncbi:hypothetical protein SDC9_71046 [bioreactor metagenome]|uniref:Uncharacterized protein n=1 Tax=bioreactor metagenome TaxID=1076179 RepID=A0A644YDG0_9ZZZZ
MAAFEVRHLRRVSCLDEGIEAGLDQGGYATAEHSLLTEEVGLGLFLERGLENACATGAKTLCIGERDILGVTAGILVDGDQRRNTLAFLELGTNRVARALGSDHDDVHITCGLDLTEMDVETMCERKILSSGEIGLNTVVVDLGLLLIGQEHHDDLGHCTGFLDGCDLQTCFFCDRPALGALVQADHHINPTLMQVQRMCMSLAAIADDGYLLSVKLREICL